MRMTAPHKLPPYVALCNYLGETWAALKLPNVSLDIEWPHGEFSRDAIVLGYAREYVYPHWVNFYEWTPPGEPESRKLHARIIIEQIIANKDIAYRKVDSTLKFYGTKFGDHIKTFIDSLM